MCKLNDQVEVDTIVASDWMKGWRYFYTPITERSKEKTGAIWDYFRHVCAQKTVYIGMPH